MLKFNFKIFSIFMNNTFVQFCIEFFIFLKYYDFKKEENISFVNRLLYKGQFLNNYIRTINYWRIVS